MRQRWLLRGFWLKAVALAALLLGCRDSSGESTGLLRLATFASLQDSGLYAALAPVFEQQANQTLNPTFAGTGEALALGRAGRADVVWVHSRAAEDAFVSEGYGLNRRDVMHSEYVIAKDMVLAKPFTRIELLTRVRKALDGPSANGHTAQTQG